MATSNRIPMHYHVTRDGIKCGKAHPLEAAHKKLKTQDRHMQSIMYHTRLANV